MTIPQGTAMAIVAIVSRKVVAVPAISASRCCHTTDQSSVIAGSACTCSRPAQMCNAAVEAVDAACNGIEHQEVQQHRKTEYLDRLKALSRHRFGLAHELRDGDHGSDRGVLDGDRQQRAECRQ